LGSRKKKRLTRAEQAAIAKSPNPESLNRLFPLDEAFIEDFSNTLYNALQIARERGAMSVKRWIEQNDERRSPKQLASFQSEIRNPQSEIASFSDDLEADLKFITGNPSAADYFRAQAFTVATVENDRIRVALKDSLEAALRNGESFESWKKNANAVFDKEGVSRLSNRHLQVVFRTNAGLAYAAAQAAMMERQKSAFPFWQYSAVMDRRTRPSHAVLNGKIFLNGDWTYLPPLGFNCRCGMIPISAAKAARRGILAPSPVTPMELAGLASTEFMGEKNFKLMEWLRRQPLTKEAAEKIAPKTVILMAGISNKPTPYPRLVEPSGAKISTFVKTDALTPEVKATVERVLNIVDSIHGVGDLPALFVIENRKTRTTLGQYTYRNGRHELVFNSLKPNSELTLLHELGHFIDYNAFVQLEEASKSNETHAAWRQAVKKTESVKALLQANPKREYINFVKYLLQPPELWARSYSQFIAIQSGDESLLNQLRFYQRSSIFTQRFSQWENDNFKVIYNAIIDVFRSQKWIS
jgi:SPP1 gp7 family putative phage head morphogenesis protein